MVSMGTRRVLTAGMAAAMLVSACGGSTATSSPAAPTASTGAPASSAPVASTGASASAAAPSASSAAGTPQKGGTLKMGRVADAVSFDPVFPTDNMSIWAKLLIFQMLIRSDATGTKLEPDPTNPQMLLTLRGMGYKLVTRE